jgi:hypothetical protein
VNHVVQAKTMVEFELQPQHIISKSDKPTLSFEFPPDVQINGDNCRLESVGMSDSPKLDGAHCRRRMQTITVFDFLAEDYIPDDKRTIQIVVGEVINPLTTFQVDGFKVTISAMDKYAIDEY